MIRAARGCKGENVLERCCIIKYKQRSVQYWIWVGLNNSERLWDGLHITNEGPKRPDSKMVRESSKTSQHLPEVGIHACRSSCRPQEVSALKGLRNETPSHHGRAKKLEREGTGRTEVPKHVYVVRMEGQPFRITDVEGRRIVFLIRIRVKLTAQFEFRKRGLRNM